MRAAIYHGRGDVRIGDVPEPPPPGPGEALLETILASVCGTDVSEYLQGPIMIPLRARHPGSGHGGPTILGHEILARVIAVGDGVSTSLVGQRVVPGAGVWCGSCSWCRQGRTNLCANYYTLGLHAHGGLAERLVAPARMCQPVPQSCPDEVAVLAQTASIAVHALHRGGGSQASSLLVVGAGGVGALIILAARARGIDAVAADPLPGRRERALRLGASHAVDTGEASCTDQLRHISGGEGFDVVMEVSGTPGGLRTALSAVRRGARVVAVGLQGGPSTIDLHHVVIDEIELTSSSAHLCLSDLPEALDVLTRAPVRAGDLLEDTIPLTEFLTRGLQPLADGRTQRKVVVTPRP